MQEETEKAAVRPGGPDAEQAVGGGVPADADGAVAAEHEGAGPVVAAVERAEHRVLLPGARGGGGLLREQHRLRGARQRQQRQLPVAGDPPQQDPRPRPVRGGAEPARDAAPRPVRREEFPAAAEHQLRGRRERLLLPQLVPGDRTARLQLDRQRSPQGRQLPQERAEPPRRGHQPAGGRSADARRRRLQNPQEMELHAGRQRRENPNARPGERRGPSRPLGVKSAKGAILLILKTNCTNLRHY